MLEDKIWKNEERRKWNGEKEGTRIPRDDFECIRS